MQQQNAFNAANTAGDAVAAWLKRHPLSLAILGVTLALQVGGALAEEQNGNGSLELVATSITDNRLGETTEGTGSYTTGSTRTATKLSLSPRETPQSVSVITRQQMDDQGLTSIGDVLSKTPGITVNKLDSSRASFPRNYMLTTRFDF
ncbi:TonB-dependent receptor plug domain-containing protein [Pseudomonas sp. OTU5201]|uniref:TonB-dependent receptor plug domain-containing protein n=1 Tax=Pseudomonas sp. OTU5201 TaxID=3043850 RepID=UPI00406D27EA